MVKSTTVVDMWPSSMVIRRMNAKNLDSFAAPGFPDHCLVTFSVRIPSKPKQHSGDITRLKRTAHFVSNLGTIITESDAQDFQYQIDKKLLSSLSMPLCPIGGNIGMSGLKRRSMLRQEIAGAIKRAKSTQGTPWKPMSVMYAALHILIGNVKSTCNCTGKAR